MENWHRTKVKRLESLTEAVVTVRNILVTAVGSDSAVPEMYYDWDHELTMRYNAYDAVTAPATLLAPRSDAPTLGLYDVSTPDQLMGFESHWQAAELLAAGFLRRVGFNDAAVTSAGADGGVDVRGAGVAAQVKYTGSPVGRPVLQQLIGATRGSRPVCFSRSGFSKQAYAYALESGIALFNLELPNNVTAKNPSAAHLVSHMRN